MKGDVNRRDSQDYSYGGWIPVPREKHVHDIHHDYSKIAWYHGADESNHINQIIEKNRQHRVKRQAGERFSRRGPPACRIFRSRRVCRTP